MPPPESFADPARTCCLLCSRQFKTLSEVHKHESHSQLHASNLQNPALLAKARLKVSKLPSATSAADEGAAYRDRALERRKAFNQPKRPAPERSAATEEETTAPVPSKGASLLSKVGFSKEVVEKVGTGGIQTDMYVAGVGLGAEGGKRGDAVKEAERMTKSGRGEFAERTREGARERFERMG
jgi:hypothetical protein